MTATLEKGATFTAAYADGNALWRMDYEPADGIWICTIVEPREYAGTSTPYFASYIEDCMALEELFGKFTVANAVYYGSLKPGDVAHYHDGFGRFVRCVVTDTGSLLPVGLVGRWSSNDSEVTRSPAGFVHRPYWPEKILDGEDFVPDASNIWEAVDETDRSYMTRSCKGFDPTRATATVPAEPKVTEQDEYIEKIHAVLKRAIDRLLEVYDSTTSEEELVQAAADAIIAIAVPSYGE